MRETELMVGDWVETRELRSGYYCLPSFKRQVAQIKVLTLCHQTIYNIC